MSGLSFFLEEHILLLLSNFNLLCVVNVLEELHHGYVIERRFLDLDTVDSETGSG